MGKERRTAERFKVNLQTRWEGVLDRHDGVVTDISSNGCFILSAGAVAQGELVRVEIQTPTEGWIYMWGEAVYLQEEIGFVVPVRWATKELPQPHRNSERQERHNKRGLSPAGPESRFFFVTAR